MPIWYYEKSELRKTPSKDDGIEFSTEARYRKEGARFIIDAGTSLGLRYDTLATGVVYFHRFYMFHSFKTFPRYVTGAACLFLAGKVEETPKKCKDIVRAAKTILPEHYFITFGEDPKEEIMTFERILLQTIKFDLQVDHPYSYLLKYAKRIKGDIAKIQKLVQMGWTFINDSLCTTLCLQWEPQVLAVAVVYLAGRLSKSDVLDWQCKSSRTKWWDPFIEDVTHEMLEDICHQVLDLYTPGQEPGQPRPKTPPEITASPSKPKGGRPKTPPEPAPSTPPPDEQPMKRVKQEHPMPVASVAVVQQPRPPQENPPLPTQPPQQLTTHPQLQQTQDPATAQSTGQHQQYSQSTTSGYAPLPTMPPVPQAPVPQAPQPPAYEVPPPQPAAPPPAYQSGTYQQTSSTAAYGATQDYQQASTSYQYSSAQPSQTTQPATTNYGQGDGYNYSQTQTSQQVYGTQEQYSQNYTTQDYSAAYGTSYTQQSVSQSNVGYVAPSGQYSTSTTAQQYSGQYQTNQYTTGQQQHSTGQTYQAALPQQQTAVQQSMSQHSMPATSQDVSSQQQGAAQSYSMGSATSTSIYSAAAAAKSYAAPSYPTQPQYDSQQQYSVAKTTTGMTEHASYMAGVGAGASQVWAPRGPTPTTPRGPPPTSPGVSAPQASGTATGLAMVRITGRTDQRRSSTGRGQPFFR